MNKRVIITIVLTICLFINTVGCNGQTKNNNMGTTLKEQMASYTSKPVYYVEYSSSGCLVDIRINDSSVQKDYNPGAVGGAVITANTAILKSGKQKVTVKLIPYRDETLITEKEPFTMRIGYKDFMDSSGDEGRPWHWVMEMPPIVMPEEGLPYYEWSGEFEAKVPYQVVGWSDCIDLREIPDIEQRVVAKFNEFRQLYIDGKYDELKRLQYSKHYELAVMLYEDENDIEKDFTRSFTEAESQDKSGYQPIEDYNLVFYADGRLVTLEKYDKEFEYYHDSALLWYSKKNEDGTADYHSYMLQFGIRKGTNELVLIQ